MKNYSKHQITLADQSAAIGISFDIPNRRESLIVGGITNIGDYISDTKKSENLDIREKRYLGQLIIEINDIVQSD